MLLDKCVNFEKEIWLDFGKAMWKNYHIVFDDHIGYFHNYITKLFKAIILDYYE